MLFLIEKERIVGSGSTNESATQRVDGWGLWASSLLPSWSDEVCFDRSR